MLYIAHSPYPYINKHLSSMLYNIFYKYLLYFRALNLNTIKQIVYLNFY